MSGLKKILYVEDDRSIAEMAMMALEDIGEFDVKHCLSGVEAVASFEAFMPQVVVLDVMMPEMDGPETLRQIRQLNGGSQIPVIFMTAKAQIHEQEEYLAMGALAVIVKPFDAVTLSDQVRTIWEESQ